MLSVVRTGVNSKRARIMNSKRARIMSEKGLKLTLNSDEELLRLDHDV